jgi:hypothetical protein
VRVVDAYVFACSICCIQAHASGEPIRVFGVRVLCVHAEGEQRWCVCACVIRRVTAYVETRRACVLCVCEPCVRTDVYWLYALCGVWSVRLHQAEPERSPHAVRFVAAQALCFAFVRTHVCCCLRALCGW